MDKEKLRVVSFNMFYALGKKRLTRTVFETFAELNPDVICLQEVLIGKKHNFARDLADHLGYHLSFSLRATLANRHMGMAILTREPPEETSSIVLPRSSSRRPRVLQIVTFQKDSIRWNIANTHLAVGSLSSRARREQITAVITMLNRTQDAIPTILAGDFNTKTKKEVLDFNTILESVGFQTQTAEPYSWKMLGVKRKLDWIAARNCTIQDAGVLQEVKGSDHKPIWADIATRAK